MRVLAAILAAGLLSGSAFACDRVEPRTVMLAANARNHVHQAEVVFEGVALGDLDSSRRSRNWVGQFDRYEVVPFETAFRVETVWKGDLEPVEVVFGALNFYGSSCEFEFDRFVPGVRYIVVGSLNPNGEIESEYGDLVGWLEADRAAPGRETVDGWQAWRPSEAVTNAWEAERERREADWFEGAGGYRGILERMVVEGALPQPYTPRRFGEADRLR